MKQRILENFVSSSKSYLYCAGQSMRHPGPSRHVVALRMIIASFRQDEYRTKIRATHTDFFGKIATGSGPGSWWRVAEVPSSTTGEAAPPSEGAAAARRTAEVAAASASSSAASVRPASPASAEAERLPLGEGEGKNRAEAVPAGSRRVVAEVVRLAASSSAVPSVGDGRRREAAG